MQLEVEGDVGVVVLREEAALAVLQYEVVGGVVLHVEGEGGGGGCTVEGEGVDG
jgi:hypothetical protein